MKKTIVLLILCCSMFSLVGCGSNEPTNKKTETQITESQETESQEEEKKPVLVKAIRYDCNMNQIETINYEYNRHGTVKQMTVYDVNGNILSKELYAYDDEYKEVVEMALYKSERMLDKVFTYEAGKLKKEEIIGSDGHNVSVYDYTLKEDGNLTYKGYNAKTKYVNFTGIIEYDSNNNILKKTVNSADGKPLHDYVYTYDENGNMLSSTYTAYYVLSGDVAECKVLNYINTYNEIGDLIKVEVKAQNPEENQIVEYIYE